MGKLIAVVVLILAIGGVFYFASNSRVPIPSETVFPNAEAPRNTEATSGSAGEVGQYNPPSSVKVFTVAAENFAFSPKTISVKKGDTVKIIFKNTEGLHDFVIDELNARTEILKAGEEETIQFVASKSGTFEFYCSVQSHREMGMVGTFKVE